jgi:hypothetical protein
LAKPFIIQRGNDITQQARGTHAHAAFAAGRCAQKFAYCPCDIYALHAAGNDFGCQEVGAQKARKGPAKPFLVIRNDRRVRNGDAKRVAEQGGDRKPVRKTADHASFGKGSQKTPMAVIAGFHIFAEDEQGGHRQQQGRGDNPHLTQFSIAFGVADFLRLTQFIGRFHITALADCA